MIRAWRRHLNPTSQITLPTQSAQVALANVLARFTVALLTEGEVDFGTGTLVAAEDAPFVATAWHVAPDLPSDDVYCVPRPHAPLRIVPREEMRRRVERGNGA